MPQLPPGPPSQLPNNRVTIPNQLHIKLDVVTRLPSNVDTRNVFPARLRQFVWHFSDRCNLHRGPDDDYEICSAAVEGVEALEKVVRQVFAEEGDVGFHHAGSWDGVVF